VHGICYLAYLTANAEYDDIEYRVTGMSRVLGKSRLSRNGIEDSP
jgi:hypothetical protein